MKKVVALLTAVCLSVTPVAVFAEEGTDYSYLEDMSVKELKALRDAINEILGSETAQGTNDAKTDTVEGLYICEAGYEEDYTYEFTADNSEKTRGAYKLTMGDIINTGDYRVNADLVMLDGDGTIFKKYGDYLVSTDSDYIGTIPDAEFFESYIYSESDYYPYTYDKYEYEFLKDGTVKLKRKSIVYADGILNSEEKETLDESSGKYEMIDNLLVCTFNDGTIEAFYVINGTPYSHVLKKAK